MNQTEVSEKQEKPQIVVYLRDGMVDGIEANMGVDVTVADFNMPEIECSYELNGEAVWAFDIGTDIKTAYYDDVMAQLTKKSKSE